MAKYKLGEICEIVGGSTPKSDVAEYWDGDIKWITPAELNEDSYILTDSVRKITALGVQKAGLSPFPKDTVILSSRAPIGKVAIAGCEMYCNQGFKNLICSSVIDCHYLYWFLKGKTEYLNSLGRGATFKEISKQIVAGIEIEVPPIEKQQDIARRFEETKRLISILKQQIQVLDQLIKTRFIEMFGDPVANSMEWKQTTMKSICKKITDGEHGSVPREDSGYPFLNAKHIKQNGNIDWQTVTYTSDKVHKKIYSRCNPEPGDILMTTTGTIGNVAIVPPVEEFSMDRGITLLKINHTIVFPQFIAWLLRFDAMQMIMKANIHASAIGHLFLNKVEQLPVIVPPIELQKQFDTFISHVDRSKVVVQKALDEAKLLFDSLMQKYFC